VIEQLFGSKTRVKLLQLFYSNPNRSFYVREITRKIDEQINSVRRELANLLSIGIITSDATQNRLYYEVNQKYEYFQALGVMFGGMKMAEPSEAEPAVAKTDKKETAKKTAEPTAPVAPKADVATEHPMAKEFRALGKVELALLTGQFTRDESAGIDVLVVGNVTESKVDKFIADLEQTENKELRYTVLSLDNYQYRLQINDRFISNILDAKKQVIINTQNLRV
jgi:hypothetical protein